MSVLIQSASILEGYSTIFENEYMKKLNKATFGFEIKCETRIELIKFLNAKAFSDAEIPVATEDCNCLKKTLNFSQECE